MIIKIPGYNPGFTLPCTLQEAYTSLRFLPFLLKISNLPASTKTGLTFGNMLYAITFSGLMSSERKGFALGLSLGLMCFLLSSVYIKAMIFAGIVSV
ncbi:MAG: hypothetical protein ABIT96_01910 [Ferruginibacter sp.]